MQSNTLCFVGLLWVMLEAITSDLADLGVVQGVGSRKKEHLCEGIMTRSLICISPLCSPYAILRWVVLIVAAKCDLNLLQEFLKNSGDFDHYILIRKAIANNAEMPRLHFFFFFAEILR